MTGKKERFDIYQAVTDQVIAALERGVVPWRKPWTGAGDGIQMNARTRKPYRGINQFLLMMSGFGSPYWLTMKQANAVGGKVRKGEHSTFVIFWKKGLGKCKPGEPGAKLDPSTGAWVRDSFLLRYYRVFNVEQIDGLPDGMVPAGDEGEPADELPRLDDAQTVLASYCHEQSIDVTEGGARAFYAPKLDTMRIPSLQTFVSAEAFYSTWAHECVHSTGHPDRLNRPGVADFDAFGSEQYGKEELVAEMGAAMLSALLRIDTPDLAENRDAYIGSWLDTIKGDPKLVIGAGAQAQKASDYIVGDRWSLLVDVTPWEDEADADEDQAAALTEHQDALLAHSARRRDRKANAADVAA